MHASFGRRGFLKTAAIGSLALLARSSPAMGAAKPKPAPAPAKPPAGVAAAPADVNDLSLRLAAMGTIYDLDLSESQLAAVKTLSGGAADPKHRDAGKSTDKLTAAMKDLYAALTSQDHEKVASLRAQVDELMDDDVVDLDDDVTTTEIARSKAAGASKLLKASQIAAYLADHADEVADPVEQLMSTLLEATDPDAEDPDTEIADTTEAVSRLVAGMDSARAKQVADQITNWFKAGKAIKPEDLPARRDAFEASAKKMVGDVSAMQVLSNYIDGEMAELLSNPQLAGAIEATLAGRKQ